MILFIVKAIIFSFLYSFIVGLVLMAVMLPIMAITRKEEPGLMVYAISFPLVVVICAIQGIMIAAAVVVSLDIDPARWDILWYIAGFVLSVPMATRSGSSGPYKKQHIILQVVSSNAFYIAACIFPQFIPPFLGDLAVRILV